MWSAAYGLIALAVVAFVALYAALHTPSVASVNLADQLYHAKKQLAGDLSSLPRTDNLTIFAASTNAVRVARVNATAYDEAARRWAAFPVDLPVGYKLSAVGGNILYEVYPSVISCRQAVLQRGGPVVLYVVRLKHSISHLPWLEVYAAVPRNLTQYYSWLYSLYQTLGRPPAVGLDPRVGADADAGLVDYVKVEWALVYDATSDAAVLYAAAPPSAPYILVVDYPLAIPLACPPR
jgi:hypothetical protein